MSLMRALDDQSSMTHIVSLSLGIIIEVVKAHRMVKDQNS
jgi:hypothetical protein